MLKTLDKTVWEEIKINEVFAYDGCWAIGIKVNYCEALCLDEDARYFKDVVGSYFKKSKLWDELFHNSIEYKEYLHSVFCCGTFYKLPESVQRLFKEE